MTPQQQAAGDAMRDALRDFMDNLYPEQQLAVQQLITDWEQSKEVQDG